MMFSKSHVLAAVMFIGMVSLSAEKLYGADRVSLDLDRPLVATSNTPAAFDPARRAANMLMESRRASEAKARRDAIKPYFPEKVVKFHTHQDDKILILGGSEALPM